jgi:AraC-like DNA-binding protein
LFLSFVDAAARYHRSAVYGGFKPMNRKNRTSRIAAESAGSKPVLVTYREFLPAPELRRHVRAFFSFIPAASRLGDRPITRQVEFGAGDSFCAPLFADGHMSIVIDLPASCRLGQGWEFGTPLRARAIGPMRTASASPDDVRAEMIGAYLEPGAALGLLRVPASELTDRVVDLDDVWGRGGQDAASLADDLAELDEAGRVDRFEAGLIARLKSLRPLRTSVDVVGLARSVRDRSQTSVRDLADAAGVSARHLSRVFEDVVGVSPKRYCRLARFRAGLKYAGRGTGVSWAQVAAELGYADQSHMIAEFREFSCLTPEILGREQWFHPFILEAVSSPDARH